MPGRAEDILTRLARGEVILGDGSYVVTLEKRGYVRSPDWTPEAACEHPDAVEQLGLEFGRAGADITQTFTFFSTDDKLPEDCKYTCAQINASACKIAQKVSDKFGTILAGGITQTGTYATNKNKAAVQDELRKALKPLIDAKVDFIILEYFRNIEEMEWAIELVKTYNRPMAATMCIGPNCDASGVPTGECAVRMARTGVSIVGVNCLFDPFITIETLKVMKKAMAAQNLKPYLMAQPLGYRDPDGGNFGWLNIPEFPYAIEPRQITRWEARRFARDAYDLGVQIIGGCCGFEPYHIRAMAEELQKERGGKLGEASKKSDVDLKLHKKHEYRKEFKNKGSKDFWANMRPCTGRPFSLPMCEQSDPQVLHSSVVN